MVSFYPLPGVFIFLVCGAIEKICCQYTYEYQPVVQPPYFQQNVPFPQVQLHQDPNAPVMFPLQGPIPDAQFPSSQFQNPQFQNPQFQNPQFQNPEFQNPQFVQPKNHFYSSARPPLDVLQLSLEDRRGPRSISEYKKEHRHKRKKNHQTQNKRGGKKQDTAKAARSRQNLDQFESLTAAQRESRSKTSSVEEAGVRKKNEVFKLPQGIPVNRELSKDVKVNFENLEIPTAENEIQPANILGEGGLDAFFKQYEHAGGSSFSIGSCKASEQLILYKYFLAVLTEIVQEYGFQTKA